LAGNEEETTVIARVWHGYTKPEHANAYEAMLKPELLPGVSRIQGYRGSYLLRRSLGDEVEFITVMLWDSIDSLRAVTGPDHETAVIPEERRKYLSHFDGKSSHYEVVSTHGLAGVWEMPRDPFLDAAIAQARKSLSEGGIPIGSVLVSDGKIIGAGHNRRVQTGSPIDHGEMNCLRNAGRLPAAIYRRSVL
jgi:heme-degrading monooxygenase HmoA